MKLHLRGRTLDLAQPRVMGVLNLTADSFSDGGLYLARDAALQRARAMVEEGASIIDVGGESTRPGAEPVAESLELERVLPVIEDIARELDVAISIDTSKPAVMTAACAAGAHLVNDVFALRAPGALEAAAKSRAGVVLMHMQGEPRTMQEHPQYADVVGEVRAFLASRVAACVEAGITYSRIVVDPGFGFGKTLEHNLALLGALGSLRAVGGALLVGLSRKSMFKTLLDAGVDQRLPASLAAATLAVWQGAAIVRAHDVRATVDAVRVAHAVMAARSGA
jgi:dihydropteroate synthase